MHRFMYSIRNKVNNKVNNKGINVNSLNAMILGFANEIENSCCMKPFKRVCAL